MFLCVNLAFTAFDQLMSKDSMKRGDVAKFKVKADPIEPNASMIQHEMAKQRFNRESLHTINLDPAISGPRGLHKTFIFLSQEWKFSPEPL